MRTVVKSRNTARLLGALRILAALAFVAGVTGIGMATTQNMAFAQLTDPQNPLKFVDQTMWIHNGDNIVTTLRIDAEADATDLSLAAIVYPRVRSTEEFTRALNNLPRGSALGVVSTPLQEMQRDANGNYLVTVPTQNPTLARDQSRVVLGTPGVYPVRFELRTTGDNQTIERRNSMVVNLPTSPAATKQSKYLVASMLPLDSPPTLSPDGKPTLEPEELARVRALTEAFSLNRLAGTLQVTGHLLDALETSTNSDAIATLATLKDFLKQPAARMQISANTYVQLDNTATSDANFLSELGSQLDEGRAAFNRAFVDPVAAPVTAAPTPTAPAGVQPSPASQDTTLTLSVPSSTTVERYIERGAKQVVMPLQSIETNSSTSGKITVDTDALNTVELRTDVRVPAYISDATAAALLNLDDASNASTSSPDETTPQLHNDPVLSGLRAVSYAALRSLDTSNRTVSSTRGMTMQFPPDALAIQVQTVAKQIAASPLLETVTVDELFSRTRAAIAAGSNSSSAPAPLLHLLADNVTPPTNDTSLDAERQEAAKTVSRSLTSFEMVVGTESPIARDLYFRLLQAESAGLSREERSERLSSITSRFEGELAKVRVPPEGRVRLTSRSGGIPVTITSDAPYDVRVRIRVIAPQLQFPQGSERDVTLTKQNTTERFEVTARGSGSFRFRIEIRSPDGALLLARREVIVQSTAASKWGVAISGLAVLVLCGWWIREWRRSNIRRQNTLALEGDQSTINLAIEVENGDTTLDNATVTINPSSTTTSSTATTQAPTRAPTKTSVDSKDGSTNASPS